MASFFISHSSRDNAAAARVRAWLEQRGFVSVFLDFDPETGIPPGRRQVLSPQTRAAVPAGGLELLAKEKR